MNVSRIISAVIDSSSSSSSSDSPFHVTQVRNSGRDDAQPDHHDLAQVLHGGRARAQSCEAQISLWSKYCGCWVLDRAGDVTVCQDDVV